MITWNLVDKSFEHIEYSAPGVKSEKVKWDRTSVIGTTFYTHEQVFPGPSEFNSGADYALLFESQAIIPHVYNNMVTHPHIVGKYTQVFTHSSNLLKLYSHAKWIPGGSIWVGGTYGGGEIKIYPKTKLCSMVSSNKTMCQLHNLRIAIADFLQYQNSGVDFFGTLHGEWTPIAYTLADYKFSICIENYVDDLYFTEKLLNCFATGTIPIYLGARDIGKLFNTKGIIQFTKPGELIDLLAEHMNDKFYEDRKDAIEENFNLCQKYRLIEDYIYNTYFKDNQ